MSLKHRTLAKWVERMIRERCDLATKVKSFDPMDSYPGFTVFEVALDGQKFVINVGDAELLKRRPTRSP